MEEFEEIEKREQKAARERTKRESELVESIEKIKDDNWRLFLILFNDIRHTMSDIEKKLAEISDNTS